MSDAKPAELRRKGSEPQAGDRVRSEAESTEHGDNHRIRRWYDQELESIPLAAQDLQSQGAPANVIRNEAAAIQTHARAAARSLMIDTNEQEALAARDRVAPNAEREQRLDETCAKAPPRLGGGEGEPPPLDVQAGYAYATLVGARETQLKGVLPNDDESALMAFRIARHGKLAPPDYDSWMRGREGDAALAAQCALIESAVPAKLRRGDMEAEKMSLHPQLSLNLAAREMTRDVRSELETRQPARAPRPAGARRPETPFDLPTAPRGG